MQEKKLRSSRGSCDKVLKITQISQVQSPFSTFNHTSPSCPHHPSYPSKESCQWTQVSTYHHTDTKCSSSRGMQKFTAFTLEGALPWNQKGICQLICTLQRTQSLITCIQNKTKKRLNQLFAEAIKVPADVGTLLQLSVLSASQLSSPLGDYEPKEALKKNKTRHCDFLDRSSHFSTRNKYYTHLSISS